MPDSFRLQTSSNGIPLLVVGRIVAGIGIGIASTMVPVYQAEIVGLHSRELSKYHLTSS